MPPLGRRQVVRRVGSVLERVVLPVHAPLLDGAVAQRLGGRAAQASARAEASDSAYPIAAQIEIDATDQLELRPGVLPAISPAVAIALASGEPPDTLRGEEVKAYVVTAPGEAVQPLAAARDRFAQALRAASSGFCPPRFPKVPPMTAIPARA